MKEIPFLTLEFWCRSGSKSLFHVKNKSNGRVKPAALQPQSRHHVSFLLFGLYCGVILFLSSALTFLSLPFYLRQRLIDAAACLGAAVIPPQRHQRSSAVPGHHAAFVFVSLTHPRSHCCGYQSPISWNPVSPFRLSFPRGGSGFTLGLNADQMLNPVISYGAWQNRPTF